MARITITTNSLAVVAALDKVARKQIPYATSLALNATADGAQAAARASLGAHFTVRRRAFLEKGIVVTKSNRRTWPNVAAQISLRDEFMARQVTGGEKNARAGGSVAIPVAARRTPTEITAPNKWPGKMLAGGGGRRKFFLGKIATGPRKGTMAVMRRTSADRYPLQVLYLLKPGVKVTPRWDFPGIVERHALRNYDINWRQALQYALDTAR
jgi:hypothetical protein